MTEPDDDAPLAVTMTYAEWGKLTEALERALDYVASESRDESPLRRKTRDDLAVGLLDLHDRAVPVEAIDTPELTIYDGAASAIAAYQGED